MMLVGVHHLLGPVHLPPLPRGPAAELRLEVPHPDLAGQHRGHRRPEGGVLMPPPSAQAPRSLASRASASPFGKDGLKTMFPDGLLKPDPVALEGRGHRAVPAREGRPRPPRPRRHRPPRGELHRRACSAPASAPTGASTSRRHKTRRRRAVRAASPVRATRSTASTSTTRCACTAASASRSARSRRCSGAPSTSTPSPHIADLLHDKDRLGEWMETVPDFEPYEAGSEPKVKKVPR